MIFDSLNGIRSDDNDFIYLFFAFSPKPNLSKVGKFSHKYCIWHAELSTLVSFHEVLNSYGAFSTDSSGNNIISDEETSTSEKNSIK